MKRPGFAPTDYAPEGDTMRRPAPAQSGYDPVNGDVSGLFPGGVRGTLPPATNPQAGGVPINGMPPQAQPPMGTPPGIAGQPPMQAGGVPMNGMPVPAQGTPQAPSTVGRDGLVNQITQRLLRSRGFGG